jgi:DNA-binding GntR family transcriptional regulator
MASDLVVEEAKTVREAVYQKLRNAIIDGYFKSGDALVERILSKDMHVSRTPIREALRKLELEGLVTNVPYRGVMVTELTREDVDQIYEVHEVLHARAAILATRYATEETFQSLDRCIKIAVDQFKLGETEKMIMNNRLFHNIIYDASRNLYIIQMMNNIYAKIALLRVKTLSNTDRAIQNIGEHIKLYNAMKNRNEKLAEEITIDHIRNARVIALEQFQSNSTSES